MFILKTLAGRVRKKYVDFLLFIISKYVKNRKNVNARYYIFSYICAETNKKSITLKNRNSMKKTVLLLLCMLLSTLVDAQTWSAPADGTFSDRYVVYVKLNLNGRQVREAAEIAAFIGGQCRGYIDEADPVSNTGFYPLQVWGNESDNGKTITFKAKCNGVAYTFTKTLSYTHQSTSTPIPFVLNIDAITGITLTDPIEITQKVGGTYNLMQHVTYVYSASADGAPYTRLGESAIDESITKVEVQWSTASNNFTVNADGILTVGHVCTNNLVKATVAINNEPTYMTANTHVSITEPLVSVTGLTLSATSFECWTGTDIIPIIEAMTTVLPADASNKALVIEAAPGSEAGFTASPTIIGYIAAKAGVWTVEVRSADNPAIKKTITVTVKQHVTALECAEMEITVDLGENVFDRIRTMVTVLPADATNKNLVLSTNDVSYIDNTGIAIQEGEAKVKVDTEDGGATPLEIKVHVVSSVNFTVPTVLNITILTPGELVLTNLTGNNFDPSLVSVVLAEDIAETLVDGSGLSITVGGKRLGNTTYTVLYNGRSRGTGYLYIDAELQLKKGWNWISNYSGVDYPLVTPDGQYAASLFSGADRIKEVRSQSALLYNDDTYGMFGQISSIDKDQMYKIDVAEDRSIIISASGSLDCPPVNPVRKGYTWITYNIIGDHSFDYFNGLGMLEGREGDRIIGKSGFAEYDGTKWIASGSFKLETGKGYIFYKNDEDPRMLNFGTSYMDEPMNVKKHNAAQRSADVWEFDANAYADNMCIAARLANIEDAENYSIGAFVGDECRGMGSCVKGDVMFINVAGNAGEKVSFRLYNHATGEYSEIAETLSYTMQCGSLKAPVTLTAPGIETGISTISAQRSDAPAYNVAGQRVSDNAKGLIIRGGKKLLLK